MRSILKDISCVLSVFCESLWYRKAFQFSQGSPAKVITQELYIIVGRHMAGKV